MRRFFAPGLLLVSSCALMAQGASGATSTPRASAAHIERQWRADLRRGAHADPKRRFPAPPRAVLHRRLSRAKHLYHFDVVSVQILRPRQAAPLVIVRSNDKHAFSKATPAILHLIDPKANSPDDRAGWAYEGFFFKALDGQGEPFLIVENHWRSPGSGGGQWAVDASLLPFPHG